MIVGIGIDSIEIQRIRSIHERHRDRFADRILTDAEKAYVFQHADPSARMAGRWAAKEAALKALGTGIAFGIRWRDVEVLPDENGKPVLTFHAKARERAEAISARRFHISITHDQNTAFAQVILEC